MVLKTPYERVSGLPTQSAIQQDPWGSLGAIIGSVMGQRAYERGVEKATATGEQELEKLFKSQPSGTVKASEELVSSASKAGVADKTISSNNTATPKATPKIENKNIQSDRAITPDIDHAIAKWGIIKDKYKDNPNPVGDAMENKKLTTSIELGLQNVNGMENFDKAQFKNALNQRLIADGRSAAQREAAWANIEPIIDAKQKTYNRERFNEVFQSYMMHVGSGDYDAAFSDAMLASQYDEGRGGLLMSVLPNFKDRYKVGADATENDKKIKSQEKIAADQIASREREGAANRQNNKDIAQLKVDGSNGRGSGSGSNSGVKVQVDANKTIFDEADRWQKAHPGEPLKKWKHYPEYLDAMSSNSQIGGGGKTPLVDISDPKALDEFIKGAIEANEARGPEGESLPPEAIARIIRREYGNSENVNKALKDNGL